MTVEEAVDTISKHATKFTSEIRISYRRPGKVTLECEVGGFRGDGEPQRGVIGKDFDSLQGALIGLAEMIVGQVSKDAS